MNGDPPMTRPDHDGPRTRSFRRAEDGSATIEIILWVPLVFALITLVVDVTQIMHAQTRLFTLARDASRQVALGGLTEAEAETALNDHFAGTDGSVAEVATDNGIVTTSLSVPAGSVGLLTSFVGADFAVRANVSMFVEE